MIRQDILVSPLESDAPFRLWHSRAGGYGHAPGRLSAGWHAGINPRSEAPALASMRGTIGSFFKPRLHPRIDESSIEVTIPFTRIDDYRFDA